MVGACLVSVAAVSSVPASAKPSKARAAQLRTSWDRSPAVNARVESLLRQMTLEEKADLATGIQNDFYGFYDNGIPRLGIPALQKADGPVGVRPAHPNVFEQKAKGVASGLALASTWDTALASRYGDVMGDE